MYKIYEVVGVHGEVKVNLGITFNDGIYRSGFGLVTSGDLSVEHAVYSIHNAPPQPNRGRGGFSDWHGWQGPNDFTVFGVAGKDAVPAHEDEEEIILFVNDVQVKGFTRFLTQYDAFNACITLDPGDQIMMGAYGCKSGFEAYEVLQSTRIEGERGTQLFLTKLDR